MGNPRDKIVRKCYWMMKMTTMLVMRRKKQEPNLPSSVDGKEKKITAFLAAYCCSCSSTPLLSLLCVPPLRFGLMMFVR